MPLYKLLFGNFSRLEAVRKGIGENGELKKAAEVLEKQSSAVIRALLDGAQDRGEVSDAAQGPLTIAEDRAIMWNCNGPLWRNFYEAISHTGSGR